ncbi:uncharacterized protein [Lepidochelys kempii]|uniref:uncharacterized protein isoform X2 n=1 Tax=Lepidochelys kempii TaxID=8472 RepID=UPI003C6F7954
MHGGPSYGKGWIAEHQSGHQQGIPDVEQVTTPYPVPRRYFSERLPMKPANCCLTGKEQRYPKAAGHKRDPVWEYFNEDPLPVGETGMHAKCKQCNKEMHGLVSRMKQYHENCYFSGGSCVEDNERNMSEYAESSGESILNIQDSEDYPPSRSPSFFIVPELSANDSVSVTSCMSHSHSISPLVKRKKTPSSRNNHR